LKRNENKGITSFAEKPKDEKVLEAMVSEPNSDKPYFGSMGIYLFNIDVLSDLLENSSYEDFGKHVIPAAIEKYNVYGYEYTGFWADIGTIRAFFETNLAIASKNPPFSLIDEGCTMIFGGSSSAVAIEACDVCQKNDVLFFGTLTYSTATTLEYGRRNCFRECNDSRMSARVLADWLNSRFSGKRYFYITSDYTWGWTTEESVREVTGTRDREAHPGILTSLGTLDFTEVLAKAGDARPEVLVLSLFGKDLSTALIEARAMGLGKSAQIVVPNLTLGMAERAGAEAMEGVVGTMPWNWKIPYEFGFQQGQVFVEEFVRRFRRYPSTSGASAYAIVHEYASAVERAGTLEVSAVIDALEDHRYTLLKDEQVWRSLDHQSVQTVYLVRGNELSRVFEDAHKQDYFSIIGFRPGEETVITPDEWKARRVSHGLSPFLEEREGAMP
ncbi:MAG: hypothetical protein EOM25_12130, partial [Deltaproteobacteria bacterium]|nr:hypothetical protein [Deltaproteobacteria bacterium]